MSQLLSVATESCISPGDERAQLASVKDTSTLSRPSGRRIASRLPGRLQAGGASTGATFGWLRSGQPQNAAATATSSNAARR